MPDYQFVLIGRYRRDLFPTQLPNNFTLRGWVDNMSAEYIKYGAESRFVLQTSRHESFGLSLVEMSSLGAYPVGSGAYALSEMLNLLGGSIVASNSPLDYNKEIQHLEKSPPDVVSLAERARREFSFAVREKKIWEVVSELRDK